MKDKDSPRKGALRKPEPAEKVTARGKTYRERQEAGGRTRWEIYVTPKERKAIKQLLSRLRT